MKDTITNRSKEYLEWLNNGSCRWDDYYTAVNQLTQFLKSAPKQEYNIHLTQLNVPWIFLSTRKELLEHLLYKVTIENWTTLHCVPVSSAIGVNFEDELEHYCYIESDEYETLTNYLNRNKIVLNNSAPISNDLPFGSDSRSNSIRIAETKWIEEVLGVIPFGYQLRLYGNSFRLYPPKR